VAEHEWKFAAGRDISVEEAKVGMAHATPGYLDEGLACIRRPSRAFNPDYWPSGLDHAP